MAFGASPLSFAVVVGAALSILKLTERIASVFPPLSTERYSIVVVPSVVTSTGAVYRVHAVVGEIRYSV